MKVTFYGASQTVTGSKFLVTTDHTKILIDCGLFQGLKHLRKQNWKRLPISPEAIDAVVLTHGHIDHSGYLPILVREGFRGPIYCSGPTRDLCEILLPDSGRIAEEDAHYANRKGFSKHSPALPLYTEADAFRALEQFKPFDISKDLKIGELTIHANPVGHILGAVCLKVFDKNNSILFSGDLGRYTDLLECPPDGVPGGNLVVMESTYGDRCHASIDPIEAIAEVVNKIVERRGVLVIPSFAVGRTQLLLYCLHQAMKRKLINPLPIYVNSPMATKVTGLYQKHARWHRLSTEQCEETFSIAKYIRTVEESKALNRKSGPMIIISASGMLTGGRILHHIKSFGPDPRNIILLPGFQAPGTRGASLIAGASSIKIHGEYIPINAEVLHWDLLSAHADQEDLIKWLSKAELTPKKVLLVHGEPQASDNLRRLINDKLNLEVEIPSMGDSYSL